MRLLACLCLLASPALAQVTILTQIQQPVSDFTWSGTSSLGPIVGNPSNAFEMSGTSQLDVLTTPGTTTLLSAAFTGGDALVVPDLHGKINNPIPFLPPLATIDVLGLHLSATSPSFAVAGGGAFTGSVTITALAGTMVVTPLGGSASNTSLTGMASTPQSQTGTLTLIAGNVHLNVAVNTTFAFTDPGTGASGTITIQGTLISDRLLQRAYGFGDGSGTACPCGNTSPPAAQAGCLNSTGVGGKVVGTGLASVSNDSFVLHGTGMPATATALYFQGGSQQSGGAGVVVGDGLRVVGAPIVRLGTHANVGGASQYPDAGDPLVSVKGLIPAAGGTYHYAIWYRNPDPVFCTVDTYNFTNGWSVIWLP